MLDGDLDIPCPECGHKTSVPVREFETNQQPQIVCGGCGKSIAIQAGKLHDALKEVGKSYDDLLKGMAGSGWKVRKG
jgi:transcription elongation factor Elf1